jgi:hypothetical protein
MEACCLLVAGIGEIFLLPEFFKLAYNYVLPVQFGVPHIDYWRSFVFLILASMVWSKQTFVGSYVQGLYQRKVTARLDDLCAICTRVSLRQSHNNVTVDGSV